MYQWRELCLMALLARASAQSFSLPLLGPDFLPPVLPGNGTFPAAMQSFDTALTQALASGTYKSGPLWTNDTSFSIAFFDANSILHEYTHSAPSLQEDASGTSHVDLNTIYRIGSVSKLLTVYLFLIEVGDGYWDESVTKFVPELKQAIEDCSAEQDPVDCIDWSSITLGALAGQMAGFPRDYSTIVSEILAYGLPVVEEGFPPLYANQTPPCALTPDDPCSRKEYFAGITKRHPVFSPFSTPIYSNSAFQTLRYALEGITNRTFETMFQQDLIQRLGLNGTTYSAPANTSRGVIPINESATGSAWSYDIGDEGPVGGFYSTTSDLAKIGQSILRNTILSPTTTRIWMKPISHTSDLHSSVGMPWEIFRVTTDNSTRVVDLYTKTGDIGLYAAVLVLIPDYNAGFVMNSAGLNSEAALAPLADLIADTYLPGLEQAAREQTAANIAGIYTAAAPLNSSLALAVEAGKPGLALKSFVSNGTDLLPVLAELYGVNPRLYPTDLVTETADGGRRVAYRALFNGLDYAGTGVISKIIAGFTWGSVDALTYGEVGLDELLITFDVESRAVAVSPRAFRVTLSRS